MSPSPSTDVERAIDILRAGGVVAFPTETVYGLGADATNREAVRRIFAIKRRPPTHPVIVHLPDGEALALWAREVPETASRLADAFWPGPLTLLLRRSDRVLDDVTGGTDVVGLRVPAHPLALALLGAFGSGIAAPSANRFGGVSPTTAAHVRSDLGAEVDLVLDGGPCEVGVESTIVDCTGPVPEVVRLGGIDVERLADALGEPVTVWDREREVAAPGTLVAHYAPAAEVVTAEDAADVRRLLHALGDGRSIGVLAPTAIDRLPGGVCMLEPAGDPANYAAVLYDRLREADQRDIDVVIAVLPPNAGIGRAIRDRLHRAASTTR